jgi:hypothetical protein
MQEFDNQPPSYIAALKALVPSVRKQRLEYIKQQLKKEEQAKSLSSPTFYYSNP